jgi:hypothetical protein
LCESAKYFIKLKYEKLYSKKSKMEKFHTSVKHNYSDSPNVLVKWLKFLLYIREVLGSNLGPETAYLFFVVFLSPSRQMLG